ncbi:MAG: energy-coupling factor ABC transporter permease [Actinomycetota bacterium]
MFAPLLHIPDGFINVPTSILFALLSVVGIAIALKGAKGELDDKTAPLAGLTTVFIFAAQMINFPVAAGTSGHLLGGALAAILIGPYAATLSITIVLLLQALLFADGGLIASGLNVFNLALIGVWGSHLIFLIVRKVLPKRKNLIPVAGFIAALIQVPLAATSFVIQYAIGAESTIPVSTVFTAMLSTHLLIGIGEALITAFTLSAVLATRSDLVFGWKKIAPKLEIKKVHS